MGDKIEIPVITKIEKIASVTKEKIFVKNQLDEFSMTTFLESLRNYPLLHTTIFFNVNPLKW